MLEPPGSFRLFPCSTSSTFIEAMQHMCFSRPLGCVLSLAWICACLGHVPALAISLEESILYSIHLHMCQFGNRLVHFGTRMNDLRFFTCKPLAGWNCPGAKPFMAVSSSTRRLSVSYPALAVLLYENGYIYIYIYTYICSKIRDRGVYTTTTDPYIGRSNFQSATSLHWRIASRWTSAGAFVRWSCCFWPWFCRSSSPTAPRASELFSILFLSIHGCKMFETVQHRENLELDMVQWWATGLVPSDFPVSWRSGCIAGCRKSMHHGKIMGRAAKWPMWSSRVLALRIATVHLKSIKII